MPKLQSLTMSLNREFNPTLRFAESLIRVPSTTDNTVACATALDMVSERLHKFPSQEFISNGVKSRLFYNTPDAPPHLRVLFNSHLDVVPASRDNHFRPFQKDGRLYGRGSGDMKGAAAVQVDVFKQIAGQVEYPLGLMVVTDEESGGVDGTGYQVSQGVRSDFVVVGEPTQLGICHQMKGRIGLRVVTNTDAAHAAYPGRVSAATDEIVDFMGELRQIFPTPPLDRWQTSAAITGIGTPSSPRDTISNTIPSQASCDVDIRHIPQEPAPNVIYKVQTIIPEHTTIEQIHIIPPAYTDPEHPDIKRLQTAITQTLDTQPFFAMQHGSCDFRWFTEVGGAGVAYGPIAANTHGADEYVEIESLVNYKRTLSNFLRSV
jgi:succinyl-diaminopimelate desuccinylase